MSSSKRVPPAVDVNLRSRRPLSRHGHAELKRRNREEHADERSTHEVGKRASQDGLQT